MVEAGERVMSDWLETRGYFDGASGDVFEPALLISIFSAMAGTAPAFSRNALIMNADQILGDVM
jgi:hypothetical protein